MITLETIATTKVGLQAQARELDISGRSKMDKEELAHAIRAALTVGTFPATVTPVETGQASCVGCHEVFNVTQTPACPTCHPVTVKATPLTVFGIPRARKFKVRRTDSRYRR